MKFKFTGKFNIGGRGDGDWNLEAEMDQHEFMRACENAERLLPQIRSMVNEVVDKQLAQEREFHNDRARWRDGRKDAKKARKKADKYWEMLIRNNIDPDTGRKFGEPEPVQEQLNTDHTDED